MTNNKELFDIFQYLQIPVTDNLEVIQKAIDTLPVRKMAELQKIPGFSNIRSFIFTKTATPAFREYVRNIRDLQLKNKPHTNANQNQRQKQRQNQTDTNRSRSEDVDARSDPEKQKEWIRQYDERANQLNKRNGNNNTQVDSDVQDSNERNPLQRLADQLNETPHRKMELYFALSWFTGNSGVLIGLLNLAFWGAPAVCVTLGGLLGFKGVSFEDILWILGIICAAGLGFMFFYPFWKAFFLFKNGFFTLGYSTERGIVYKDASEMSRSWTPSQFYRLTQPFMDCIHYPDDPYLVVIDNKNPEKLLVLDAVHLPEKDNLLGFKISMENSAIIVLYNLQSKTFFSESPRWWRWIIPAGIVLWTVLWFYAVFLTGV